MRRVLPALILLSLGMLPVLTAAPLRAQVGRPLFNAAFSPDGQLLAVGRDDGTIFLLDVATQRTLARLRGHTDLVRSLAFSPAGQLPRFGPK